jgi:hypothetical protein
MSALLAIANEVIVDQLMSARGNFVNLRSLQFPAFSAGLPAPPALDASILFEGPEE